METADWYELGTYVALLGGYFSLLATHTLDALMYYRYDSTNLLQYLFLMLLGAPLAVIVLDIVLGKKTVKEGIDQGKGFLKTISGKTDEEVDQIVDTTVTKIKNEVIKTASSAYQTQKDKMKTRSRTAPKINTSNPKIVKMVQNVHLAIVNFPNPSELYQEVTQKFQSQILAVQVQSAGLAEQMISITPPELDKPDGLEPINKYQKRSMWTFITMLTLMIIINVVVRFFPPTPI